MNVSVNFPAEIETKLIRNATAAGKDVATLVQEYVAERLAEEIPQPASAISHAEFMAKLQHIIDLHPASTGFLDDSRESIYDER